MATEIWHDFGEDAPVTLIPVADGRLEVYADGEKLSTARLRAASIRR